MHARTHSNASVHPVLLGTLALFAVQPAFAGKYTYSSTSDNGVTPTLVIGNPSCSSLGYAYGFKPSYTGGTYTFTFPGTGETVTLDHDGTSMDFTSTLALDAVIMKGGPAANVYAYDPAETSDGGLVTPKNKTRPYGLSHVELCWDDPPTATYDLEVSKTADTSYDRDWTWTIDKSGSVSTLTLDEDESYTISYDVDVSRSYTDSGWSVSGDIEIYNPDPSNSAIITSVTDLISGGVSASVTCDYSLPHTLGPGKTLWCDYTASLPDASSRTNTATVSVSSSSKVGGGEGTAAVTFGSPTTVTDECATVTDSYAGTLGTTCADELYTYTRTVSYSTCGDYEVDNVATFTTNDTGTSGTDRWFIDVDVACDLAVSKTATTSYDRKWNWTIDKTGSVSTLSLDEDESGTISYDVGVSRASVDSGWEVSGEIAIYNPDTTYAASIASVTDLITGGISASVTCDETLPHDLAAGDTLYCDYTATLPDGASRTNTATVSVLSSSLVGGGVGSAAVTFGDPDTETDECVAVTDTYAGALGTTCADRLYEYDRTVSYSTCGDYEVDNVATYTANDTGTSGTDRWDVDVSVSCGGSCPIVGSGLGHDFNLLTEFGITGSTSDIQGAAATGGDADFSSYSVASIAASATGDGLVVDGDLTFSDGTIGHGDLHVGGTCSLTRVTVTSGGTYCSEGSGTTWDAGLFTDMCDLSDYLAALTATGTVSTPSGGWGEAYLSGSESGLNVFDLDLSDAGGLWNPSNTTKKLHTLNLSAPTGSTVVINVSGPTSRIMQSMGFSYTNVDATDVLYNFNGATALTITGVGVPGSILACDADIDASSANIDGQVIAATYSGSGELHDYEFDGDVCE